ncbi:hypothetical protein [Spartinivicinus ruber]|nr:hypothetical protein [Spartinivicinus ruber]
MKKALIYLSLSVVAGLWVGNQLSDALTKPTTQCAYNETLFVF